MVYHLTATCPFCDYAVTFRLETVAATPLAQGWETFEVVDTCEHAMASDALLEALEASAKSGDALDGAWQEAAWRAAEELGARASSPEVFERALQEVENG